MAICRCRLSLLPNSQFLSLDSDLFWLQQWGLPVVHAEKYGFHLSMLSPYDLQRVLDQPVQYALASQYLSFSEVV